MTTHLQKQLSWKRLLLSRAQLKASSRTSALMAGFAMIAMVEIQLNKSMPASLVLIFSLLTTFLICVHVFALMISICILPNLEVATALNNAGIVNVESGISWRSAPWESPHDKLKTYISVAWIFSTGLGTLLFLLEIPVLLWMQFYSVNKLSAIVASAVMVPVCVLFVIFAIHFHTILADHKISQSSKDIEELQLIATQLETVNSQGNNIIRQDNNSPVLQVV